MGKAKKRSFNNGINDKFPYMTRESALNSVISNIENKSKVKPEKRLRRKREKGLKREIFILHLRENTESPFDIILNNFLNRIILRSKCSTFCF